MQMGTTPLSKLAACLPISRPAFMSKAPGPHPSRPDMVLLGPMKRDAGSCDFILLSLTWSKVLLRLWATKLCMPKTL